MSKQVLFNGTFKTVKKGEGKDAVYEISLITKDGEGENAKENIVIIGENKQLVGAKKDAIAYAIEKDPKATHITIIHHKPGREKDAKEVINTSIKKAV